MVSPGSATKLENHESLDRLLNICVLNGKYADWHDVCQQLPIADVTQLSTHGTPYGFELYDRFVTLDNLTALQAGIVNIGSCYAAAEIENIHEANILLSFLRQGAAICVGSTGIGIYSLNHLSSPSVPLGEQVFLLNYCIWKNTGTKDRAVLFGGPTLAFAQSYFELIGFNEVNFSLPEIFYCHLGAMPFLFNPLISLERSCACGHY